MGHEFHCCADDVLEGVAVFFDDWCALGHYEEGGGAGAEVVGHGKGPKSWGEEEAVAVKLLAEKFEDV